METAYKYNYVLKNKQQETQPAETPQASVCDNRYTLILEQISELDRRITLLQRKVEVLQANFQASLQ